MELLQKLLKGEIKTRAKRNVVQVQSFRELLEKAMQRYPQPGRSRRPR
ncbi:type I restriction enzyme endonuclease domain-containing protein [Synechococcus sp. CBW1107]|nr:type I restriction enzyme endonuclease domain-containing protein [Synechococcus sp. CBW1107]